MSDEADFVCDNSRRLQAQIELNRAACESHGRRLADMENKLVELFANISDLNRTAATLLDVVCRVEANVDRVIERCPGQRQANGFDDDHDA